MDDLIRRSEAQELLECYTEKNNLGHTPYQIVSNLPSAGPKWIPVEERLPKEDEVVLVFGGRSIYTAYYGENRWGGIGWHKLNSKYHNCSPTHWMPLPEPPKVGVSR